MRHRNVIRLLIVGVCLSGAAALYCFGGILTAASLFTGDHAQQLYEFWRNLLVLAVVAFVAFGVVLVLTILRARSEQRDEGAI